MEGFPAKWLTDGTDQCELYIDNHLYKNKFKAEGNEITERTDKNGFINTEDLVEIKEDRVFFKGRSSGAINVGGNKVIPEEVEEINSYQGIINSVIYPKKSSILGNLVFCNIEINKNNQDFSKSDLLKFLKTKLPLWKIPKSINIVEKIKVNNSGKISR